MAEGDESSGTATLDLRLFVARRETIRWQCQTCKSEAGSGRFMIAARCWRDDGLYLLGTLITIDCCGTRKSVMVPVFFESVEEAELKLSAVSSASRDPEEAFALVNADCIADHVMECPRKHKNGVLN